MIIEPFSRTYDGKTVLEFPGTELQPSKIYAIIGANGSGKSTFARILAGVEKADGNAHPCDSKKIGYMPQKSYAFRMSLFRNILLNTDDEMKADELLKSLKLTELKSRKAKSLSGGETARMALARMLANRYELLILDEPTAAMDMESTLISEEIIRQYAKESNCSVILITHSVQQAKRIADYTLYFEKGLLEEYDITENLITDPANDKTRKFLEFYGA